MILDKIGAANIKKRFLSILENESLKLGSDIPFFLNCKPSLVSGVGEIKEFVNLPQLTGILGVPGFGFSTPAMYAALKKTLQTENVLKSTVGKAEKNFYQFIKTLQIEAIDSVNIKNGGMPENEFFRAAKESHPEKAAILSEAIESVSTLMKKNLSRAGIKKNIYASMSGSGSSFFSIIVDDKLKRKSQTYALNAVYDEINRLFPDIYWTIIRSV